MEIFLLKEWESHSADGTQRIDCIAGEDKFTAMLSLGTLTKLPRGQNLNHLEFFTSIKNVLEQVLDEVNKNLENAMEAMAAAAEEVAE